MDFRTVIEPIKTQLRLCHDRPVLLLGSCFSDEIGERLYADGFDVLHNPFGALYNPISIANCVRRCSRGEHYTQADLTAGPRGWHCLDYASRFSGIDAETLLAELNRTFGEVCAMLQRNPMVIITLGSAYVYRHKALGKVVGNCHKFPASDFEYELISPGEARSALGEICQDLATLGIADILFTISPIRHLAYGLHGNSLSKAILQLAVNDVCRDLNGVEYFPSFEIMLDDLRDYRFYARDMKHPSDVAVDYIYGIFCGTYMDNACRSAAEACRRSFKASQHRQIL